MAESAGHERQHFDKDGCLPPVWLIVGSTGRVGRLLTRRWSEHSPAGVRVVAQGRSPSAPFTWSPLEEPLPSVRPPFAGVLVLAGAVPSPGADFDLNTRLAEACLAAAADQGAARVLVASSSAVYGSRDDGRPFGEDDETRPIGAYGASKLAMERVCGSFASSDLNVCCLRIGNVAGADALLSAAAKAGASPLCIDRYSNGRGPLRSYIGPATLARVLESLFTARRPLPPVLNVGAPVPVEMSALADAAGAAWEWSESPPRSPQHIVLDCSRLAAYHPFAPSDSEPSAMIAELREGGPQT